MTTEDLCIEGFTLSYHPAQTQELEKFLEVFSERIYDEYEVEMVWQPKVSEDDPDTSEMQVIFASESQYNLNIAIDYAFNLIEQSIRKRFERLIS